MICTVQAASAEFSLFFDTSMVAGTTPVLLLHSALASSDEMKSIRALFSERSTITLDLPGHGRSTESTSSLTTDVIAKALDAFLEQLQVPQVDIVGYSLGGYMALALATINPKRVRSVVTHAMKFYWTPNGSENALATFAKATVEQRALAAMDSIIRTFAHTMLTADAIRAANIPVLLTTGERDEFVTPNEVARLWSEIRHDKASLTIFPNCGHSLRKLPLDTFEQSVREFWEGF
jgi:pimeloyl-ACP methyl ester carboxylesterase